MPALPHCRLPMSKAAPPIPEIRPEQSIELLKALHILTREICKNQHTAASGFIAVKSAS